MAHLLISRKFYFCALPSNHVCSGRHFGDSKGDLNSVRLAGVPCLNPVWNNAKNVQCTTDASPDRDARTGAVEVETITGGTGASPEDVHWSYNPRKLLCIFGFLLPSMYTLFFISCVQLIIYL